MKLFATITFIAIAFSMFAQILPPPPPPPPSAEESVFKVVEQMPRFPGCEDDKNLTSQKEKQLCAKDLLFEYINQNLVYPLDQYCDCLIHPSKSASNDKYKTAVVQFQVMKDGTLEKINIVRDPGEGRGQAAYNAIKKMNEDGIKWIPGRQRGRPVVVQYTLPVKFTK